MAQLKEGSIIKKVSGNELIATKEDMDAKIAEKVKTDVPSGAKFTDTITTINGKTGAITKADVTALGIPAKDTTYGTARTGYTGLMGSYLFYPHPEFERIDANQVHDDTYGLTVTQSIAKLDVDKANKTQVLTDVPANAKFTDTNTTYSEISTAEIDAGTASTLRTITGRRVKYILDKVQGWIGGLTKSDVGLSNVDNLSAASIRSGTTKANVGLGNVNNNKQMPIAGGTFTGVASAQANTSYTTRQLRNTILSTGNPSGGSNGDIWIKYK